MKTALKWTLNNAKLAKTTGEAGAYRVAGFGLPAVQTCPRAGECRKVCYATQGSYRFSGVVAARAHNLALARAPRFAETLKADMAAIAAKFNVVRIHDSGDFFSQKYLDAWVAAARAFPGVIFYAYTKSFAHLNFSAAPENFRVTQSLGGKDDLKVDLNKPHARIFADDAARVAAGYLDGNVSDALAIEGAVKIGLVYHGNRNLTDSQKETFS